MLVDVATGTADVALEACAPRRGGAGRRASSAWTSPARCWRSASARCRRRGSRGRIVLVHGDAMRLPVAERHRPTRSRSPSASATCTTASVACAEMARVLQARRPPGHPRVRRAAGARAGRPVPVVLPGGAAARRAAHLRAHRRLLVSAGLGRHLHAAGRVRAHARAAPASTAVRADPLTIGIVYLYTARRRVSAWRGAQVCGATVSPCKDECYNPRGGAVDSFRLRRSVPGRARRRERHLAPRGHDAVGRRATSLVILLILFGGRLALFQPSPEELEQRRLEALRQQQEQERNRQRFVFVEPRVDKPAPTPPPRPELSDLDRRAAAPRGVPQPDNPLPLSRGNSAERAEAEPAERARGEETPDARSPAGARAAQAGGAPAGARPRPAAADSRLPEGRERRARRRAAQPAALRPERDLQQPAGRAEGSRARRSSSTPRVSSSARGSAASSPRCGATGSCPRPRSRSTAAWCCSSTSTATGTSPTSSWSQPSEIDAFNRAAVQRHPRVEPDRAAAARVSRRQGVLHRHVLLQRAAQLTRGSAASDVAPLARRCATMPTRTQQLGLHPAARRARRASSLWRVGMSRR